MAPALQATVAQMAHAGWRVEYVDQTSAVVVRDPEVNHVAHGIVSLLTLGLWLIPWLLIAVTSRPQRRRLTVDEHGQVHGAPPVLLSR